MWTSLTCREERQLELADLDFVDGRQLRLVDLLAVHVRSVQAPHIADEPRAVGPPVEDRVFARNGDVVEKHVALRASSRRRRLLLQQEG